MGLKLGKSFDRNYNIRLPFMNGFYDIGIFFNRKSTFLLFSVESSLTGNEGVKVNMFKNLESSKFCETCLELHNYRKNTLDISNQFKEIKSEFFPEVSFILNETLTLSKVEIDEDRTIGHLIDCTSEYNMEKRECKRKYPGIHFTPSTWLVKLLIGPIDPSYDQADETTAQNQISVFSL